MYAIGIRVGAILSMDDETVNLLGYGTYDGDEIPVVNGMEVLPIANPKITLDSGKVVWGCECWWGPEDKIKEQVEGKEIVEVDIDEARAQRGVD
jgi:hypothetical protein